MTAHLGTGPGEEPPDRSRPTGWLDDRLTRLGVTGPLARDALLAVAVAGISLALMVAFFRIVAPAEGIPVQPGRAELVTALSAGQALLLCLRRARPLTVLALVVLVQIVVNGLLPPELTGQGLAGLVAAYTVGTLLPLRRALVTAGVAGLAEAVGTFAVGALGGSLVLGIGLGHLSSAAALATYLGAVLVGGYVATHRRYVELLRVRAAEAVRNQRTKVQAAIGAERSRMARELHDVAAHHLSGMVVQAAAVQALIDRDPERAKAGVAWIRTQGKETLENLRLVVGVLRGRPGQDPQEDRAPVPGLGALTELVANARDLALPVELVREGPPREVSPIADVALYRMVQESLSNARQHAPGAPVRVELTFRPREVRLRVVNGPAPRGAEPVDRTSSGVGLIGMRERAQLIGAEFTAGPTPAGGWSVAVTLPTPGDHLREPTATPAEPESAAGGASEPTTAQREGADPA